MLISTVRAYDLVRRFLDAYERHDFNAMWEFYDPNCSFPVLARFGIEPGRANYRAFMTTFANAFPDLRHTIENLMTDGEEVWALYTMEGTHRGPLRNIEPTGRRIRYQIVAMYKIVDEKIVQADFVSEEVVMRSQLGVDE